MRLIRTAALGVSLLIVASACASQPAAGTPQPDAQGWLTLFNGRDLTGWLPKIYPHDVGVNFGNTFRAESGMIRVKYDQYGDFADQYGHLHFMKPYSYFHLKFEYRHVGRMQRGAPSFTNMNSGVMFHSQDPRTMLKEQNWPISVEMQLYSSLGDGRPRPTGNMCSPGTEIIYQGRIDPRHCINSNAKTYPPGQWVRGELRVLGDSLVQHIIEGDTVLTYTKPHMKMGTVTGADPKIFIDGKPLTEGYISLQSEGQPIDFREIRILDLVGCTDRGSAKYRPYFVKGERSRC